MTAKQCGRLLQYKKPYRENNSDVTRHRIAIKLLRFKIVNKILIPY